MYTIFAYRRNSLIFLVFAVILILGIMPSHAARLSVVILNGNPRGEANTYELKDRVCQETRLLRLRGRTPSTINVCADEDGRGQISLRNLDELTVTLYGNLRAWEQIKTPPRAYAPMGLGEELPQADQ